MNISLSTVVYTPETFTFTFDDGHELQITNVLRFNWCTCKRQRSHVCQHYTICLTNIEYEKHNALFRTAWIQWDRNTKIY